VAPVWPHDLQSLNGSARAGIEPRGHGQMAVRLGHRHERDRVSLQNVVGVLPCDTRPSTLDHLFGNSV
jgi:hypothetical protein